MNIPAIKSGSLMQIISRTYNKLNFVVSKV